jgi:hypothetical protein
LQTNALQQMPHSIQAPMAAISDSESSSLRLRFCFLDLYLFRRIKSAAGKELHFWQYYGQDQ